MATFPLDPTGVYPKHGWRPLVKADPLQRGWDVFDLQSKLEYIGVPIDVDGVFGPQTDQRVRDYQGAHGLTVDGIAGAVTQVDVSKRACGRTKYPARVLGQCQKETSLLCGIASPTYTTGTQDRGPFQENTGGFPNTQRAFDFGLAASDLIKRIEAYFTKYRSWGVAEDRAWAAAQGSWNSPVYADRYARGEAVPDAFLEYVRAVTLFA